MMDDDHGRESTSQGEEDAGMGIDRTNGNSDDPESADQGNDQADQSDRRTPADRSGEQGNPSRTDARGALTEAKRNPIEATTETNNESSGSQEDPKFLRETPRQGEQGVENNDGTSAEPRKESDGTSAVPDTGHGRADEQKLTDTCVSPLERMPSYGNFSHLGEEFAARSSSREITQRDDEATGETSESGTEPDHEATNLNEESAKSQIDPFAPELDKYVGRKEPFRQTIREKEADWTEGVDDIGNLPTGEKLAEGDDSKASRFDRFRRSTRENVDSLTGQTEKGIQALDKIFGPRPTGHAETRVDSGPAVVEAHHPGIDVGTAASSLLTLGIVGVEATGWVMEQIQRRRGTDGEGHR
jgi:hypothetical protein